VPERRALRMHPRGHQKAHTEKDKTMATKRTIEIFSAGCPACQETVELVNRMACPSCEVTVLDMHTPEVARRAKSLGIRSLPAVVMNGALADCCTGRGVDEAILRAAGVGQAL
jgi:glutaredoxin 3